jgi:hypothetical protein
MINKKYTITSIIGLLFFIQLATAVSIDIDIDSSFRTGEEVSFDYTILSEESQFIEYAVIVGCPSAPLALFKLENTTLEANVPFVQSYVYLSAISNNIEPQMCNATVGILYLEVVSREPFEIIALPSFDFDVMSCLDEECLDRAVVFPLNTEVYFDFDSEISNVEIKANLIYPDKSEEEIILPTSLKLEQIGTYDLELMGTSPGYKDNVKTKQFGVITELVSIPYSDVRVPDKTTEKVVIEEIRSERFPARLVFYFVLGLIILGVIVFFIVKILRGEFDPIIFHKIRKFISRKIKR